ncbi:hypothetical protein CcaCcLH18_05731 [Colletotrichum camelliae]|nr:hypothetical protein CcaCcLH18_05731 [Colletotrichum camelliae]
MPSKGLEPIAIIGMGCRFPGDATSPSKLWDLCAEGRDGWSQIPKDRFDVNSLYDAHKEAIGRNHVTGGHFMKEDVGLFDAAFFNLPGDVANTMDPQIRLLLETVYEATEDAGIPIEKLAGSDTSVFAGCYGKDYHDMLIRDLELLPPSFLTGTYTTMLANRISHFYDLKGASVSLDTACESKMAIAGASSTMLSPDLFVAMSTLGLVGKTGKCYAWDSRAEGYGRGEGVAALLLKPLSAALADGDHIHSIIRDIGLNQDGRTATITSPSLEAQVELIKACYARAGLSLSETGYVEAHMTGTEIGDATEAEALARTFGKSRSLDDPILVGSVKTNIGHTEPVSGLAAIIKASLSLQHQKIAPNLNYEQNSSKIDMAGWNLQVPTELMSWPRSQPLRASINNFGYGGTNAHVILESASCIRLQANGHAPHTNGENRQDTNSNKHRVYILSAKDEGALHSLATSLATHLRESLTKQGPRGISEDDLSFTLAERRSRLPWVWAVRSDGIDSLADRLAQKPSGAKALKQPRVGFVFNGQGAQWYKMGRELIGTYMVFDQAVQRADRILRSYGAEWSLFEELMRDEQSSRVSQIDLAQPMTVALQMCLVDLLKSWDIAPAAVCSHSSGEIAAAYAAGALSFEEALGVVYYRGKLALENLQSSSPVGGMLAAGISESEALDYIADEKITTSGRLMVACVNSPQSVTISGDISAIDSLVDRLVEDNHFARKLKVPVAYHSHHMLSMAEAYSERLHAILSSAPGKQSRDDESEGVECIFSSPVTGGILPTRSLSPDHWVRNLTSPVLFSQAFEQMCFGSDEPNGDPISSNDRNVDCIIEIGPHSTLAGPIRQILKGRQMGYSSCLQRSQNAVETMQDMVCELLAWGHCVNLRAVNSPSGKAHAFIPGLPSYPWNHTKKYWVESRISKELRYKKFPPHPLIGLPLPGSASGVKHTWRNFLRLSELPWLADHQVESAIVFPAAAYVSMAIEALRLVAAPPEKTFRGFKLRDVGFKNALSIPDSSAGVEIQICLSPCSDRELDHRGWYEFDICSLSSGKTWIENCSGFVSVITEGAKADLSASALPAPDEDTFFGADAKIRHLDVGSLYATMETMSISYGPTFKNISSGRVSQGKTAVNFNVADVGSTEELIHATTLDSIIQATCAGLPHEVTKTSMVLPRSIGSLIIPWSIPNQAGKAFKVFSSLTNADRHGVSHDVAVCYGDSPGRPSDVIRLDKLFLQAVPLSTKDGFVSGGPSICSKMSWELDILHQIPSQVQDAWKISLTHQEADFEKKLLRGSYYLIHDALVELENEDGKNWAWHHRILFGWMKAVRDLGRTGALGPRSANWSRAGRGIKQLLYDDLSDTDASGRLTVSVGQNLASIVRGEVTPLELMMEGNLLNQYYMELPRLRSRTYKHLSKVAELYAVKNPGAKVLEIGGGTGGASETVLQAFGARGDGSGSLLGHYTFTDVSSGFFEAAKQKLSSWTSIMDFQKLDIEKDPAEQGFETGGYDLIVASMVLHATKNLRNTMSNVRKLLKPNGKLLMIETTQDRLDLHLIFGTLPGWWLSEEPDRNMSPNVSLQVWEEVLQETGFSGIDFDIGDCQQSEFQCSSIILTTAVPPESSYPSAVSIVYPTTPPPKEWLDEMARAIERTTGGLPAVQDIGNFRSQSDTVCVFVAEMEEPLLHEIDQLAFHRVRDLLIGSRGVLWLSWGSIRSSGGPEFAQSQGLLRTLRQEDTSKKYIHLDFDAEEEPIWTEDKIRHISHVFRQCFDYSKRENGIDWEYSVKDCQLHVPRVYGDRLEDAAINDVAMTEVAEVQPFEQPGRTLEWEPAPSRLLSDLKFTDRTGSDSLPSGTIEIAPEAFGLNFRDVMVALGQLDDTLVGHDTAGVITRLGPGTEASGLAVGDKVCGLANGRFSSSDRAYAHAVAKIPDNMAWEDAAAIPVVYTTAYHSLLQIAHLQRGESVLIHAATGGVGQAAIVLAQHVGAEIFATCSTEAKRDLLIQRYNIRPNRIFSSRNDVFAASVMAQTNGRGVDVILNSLSGSLLKASWDCVARFGRFVEIGKTDIEASRNLGMAAFGRCALYAGVDVLQMNEYSGEKFREALTESIRIIQETQLLHPLHPIEKYSIAEMEKAMRKLQGGTHVGKLVLVPEPDAHVNVISRVRSVSLDDSNATFLVIGGLGGIARAITWWMVEKGAKNVLLVSRNAESHPQAREIADKARAEGCNLVIKNCDVSNERDFLELLETDASMPPIRGVVNGAMVLDDTVLERMTFAQWQRAIQPKVASSINIHKHLPDLSFFVMLSSLTGVAGHVSQANYAAGNTFQDALARHRVTQGQAAVSIDLSAVNSVGYVAAASNADAAERVRSRVEALGTVSMDISVILKIVEEAALRNPRRQRPEDAQIIVGLAPWDRLPEDSVIRRDQRFGTLRLGIPRGSVDDTGPGGGGVTAADPTTLLVQAITRDGTEEAVVSQAAAAIAARLAAIFNVPVDEVDPAASLTSHGVDSLVAVELRNWLAAVAKAKVSIFDVVQSESLNDFAALVISRSDLAKGL